MIIVELIGGLGNQMFQAAFGKMLSLKYNRPLFLDAVELLDRSPKPDFTYRDYELSIFEENFRIVSNPLVFKGAKKINNSLLRIRFDNFFQTFTEGAFDQIERLPWVSHFRGYWQSENHFKSFEREIRHQFTFEVKPSELNAKLINEATNSNSVAVHVRRGDYLSNKGALEFHGVCSVDYYNRAIEMIKAEVSETNFYVFSDDIEWAKSSLSFGDSKVNFIDHNRGKNSFEDMRLMSSCMHNIIANSSFSWWGAWLNNNKDKLVIAPTRWYLNEEANIRANEHLIPESWIKI